jgi:hypothetical protein
MCAAVSAGERFLNEQASSSARTACCSSVHVGGSAGGGSERTPQTIDSPLLELLQRNIQRRRHDIEVQSMPILDILVRGRRELFLAMVDIIPAFGIDAREVLSYHLAVSLN